MDNNRFIYFDVGNTLVDCLSAFKTATEKFQLKENDLRKVFNDHIEDITKGNLDANQFWELCTQRYNIQNALDYNFLESWVSDYKPITPMHEVVKKVKSKYRIGLLSNIYKGMQPILLEKGLIPTIQYDQIVFSCDVGMMKPHPDIYLFAQKQAQVDPRNILLIDDRQDFLDEAKKAGWNTFLFSDIERTTSTSELEKFILTIWE